MKTLTVRLPDALVAEIDAESRERHVSRSDVVRERLESVRKKHAQSSALREIADLVGSVHGLPADLSSKKDDHLRRAIRDRKRPR
ncbi:MAG TPA: ribbon-helix-helix protein, CopG family [Gammaproteobacteria bacterium]|nr:ribbon-helix-helix protein, CopG family [Gammaproteobacteria bacterium]